MGLFDTLSRNVATAGNALGLGEGNVSEFIASLGGSKPTSYTQPYFGQSNAQTPTQSPQTNLSNYSFGQQPAVNWPASTGGGSVLGTSTGGGTAPRASGSTNQPQQQSQSMSLPSNDQSGQINSGWDSYTNQLNDILNNNLPQQRQSQEQLAQNAYNTGVNQLGQQKASSEQEVAKQQATSLKDLASNVQNLFNAGNTYLGARGASDSSAANQYSYAISKMGTKARGDIQSQAQDRLSQIGDIYNSEINRLESDKTTQLAGIAQWFSEAQAALKQQLGQAGLNRSQDLQQASQNLYNQALQVMQNVQAEQANRRSALESWALSNSKTVQEAMQNLQTVQQMPQFGGIQGGMPQVTPEGQQYIPTGYGATTNEQKDIFGNRIL